MTEPVRERERVRASGPGPGLVRGPVLARGPEPVLARGPEPVLARGPEQVRSSGQEQGRPPVPGREQGQGQPDWIAWRRVPGP